MVTTMEPESPPKRMTRARAAAKAEAAASKATRIVTAAARAKTARPPSVLSRRNQPQDSGVDEELDDDMLAESSTTAAPKPARGRPKKAVHTTTEDDDQPAARPRGRPKKAVVEPPKEEAVKAPRGRPKKIQPELDTSTDMLAEAPKKPRGRPPLSSKSTTTARKTVTFQEPEKENMVPAKAKNEATGLRAKPVRKAAPATKAARPTGKAPSETQKVVPLSPKKVTQIPVIPKEYSDDELALDDSPIRRMPSKATRRPPVTAPRPDDDELGDPVSSAILGSPPRRLPQQPASPPKASILSPARRVEIPTLPPVVAPATPGRPAKDSVAQPAKASLLQSPPKRFQPRPLDFGTSAGANTLQQTPFRGSLLQSPRRFVSPAKTLASPTRQVPAVPTKSPERRKSILLSTSQPDKPAVMSEAIDLVDPFKLISSASEETTCQPSLKEDQPDALSVTLPQMVESAEAVDEHMEMEVDAQETDLQISPTVMVHDHIAEGNQPMEVDEGEPGSHDDGPTNTNISCSPTRRPRGVFELRQSELDPYRNLDTDSEDELASPSAGAYNSRKSGHRDEQSFLGMHTPATKFQTPSRHRTAEGKTPKLGFTPLVQQLRGWGAPTPSARMFEAMEDTQAVAIANDDHDQTQNVMGETTVETSFFEDEMRVRETQNDEDGEAQPIESAASSGTEADALDTIFDDVKITDEDLALATEANEMSVMEPHEIEQLVHPDDSVSEASEEYGDENAIPIDPALFVPGQAAGPSALPFTPVRTMVRTVHTVSKVPLKPADDSTPSPLKKRSASVSRLPVQRSRGPGRSATVISYSPTKGSDPMSTSVVDETEGESATPGPVTPARSASDAWSSMGTPARTPRRDLNPGLLRGVVAFVDVHTSEGADASGIFVELLTQMGAKCLKSWSWNPSPNSPPQSSDNPSHAASKIGITHVVYKDGGKRTLEKVRESGGVVQCVGVSWVLDCERENRWLDEAPYYVDTTVVPRGGGRRRKSMEPRALANLNGMLVPTPGRSSNNGHCSTAPSTPIRRRESVQWMRTPPEKTGYGLDADEEANDSEWDDAGLLIPVPPTPAPEAIASYVDNMSVPETPTTQLDDSRSELMVRTCPPKQYKSEYAELGEGILAREKDERVLMRLMAARRKSLQFAPKVASPLSKSWD